MCIIAETALGYVYGGLVKFLAQSSRVQYEDGVEEPSNESDQYEDGVEESH